MSAEILKESIDFSYENVQQFSFKKKVKKDIYTIGIYCSLIELAKSFHTLLSAEEYTGSLSIYRTYLENYVELINLTKNEDYTYNLDLEYCNQQVKYLKSANAGNKYLKSIKEYADNGLEKYKEELAKIKLLGHKKLQVKDKFINADLEDEYSAIYAKLCAESHCNLESMFNRHLKRDKINGGFNVVINSDQKSGIHESYLIYMPLQLTNAGILVSQSLNSSLLKSYKDEHERIARLICDTYS